MGGKLKIYGDGISGNCLKVKWVADYLGLSYEWIETSVLDGQTRTPEFLARAQSVGRVLRETMEEWQTRYDLIGDVRGLGAMMLMELVKDRETREPAPEETLAIVRRGVANGLLLIRAGLYSNCVRLLPPLTIGEDQLAEGLSALEEAVAHVAGQRQSTRAAG